MKCIRADWPAPDHIHALTTTRQGGASAAPYEAFNLGDHVNDDPLAVQQNREQLQTAFQLPSEPKWLQQTHSTLVANLDDPQSDFAADASFSRCPNTVCAVLTADCLPILICDQAGKEVAAIHAGWRGLANGIVQQTLAQLNAAAQDCLAWLGPAIGPERFEVGEDVLTAYLAQSEAHRAAFKVSGDRYLANIYQLARTTLAMAGLEAIYGGQHCTHQEQDDFFSYRRDGVTGRMASLIWIAKHH